MLMLFVVVTFSVHINRMLSAAFLVQKKTLENSDVVQYKNICRK